MKKLLTLIIAAGLLTGCVQYKDGKPVNPPEEKDESKQSSKDVTITQDEFKKLKEGMTIDEVEKIVGGLSEDFEVDEDNPYPAIDYTGEDGVEDFSMAHLYFADGKLETKNETGLLTKKELTSEKAPAEDTTWDDLKDPDKIVGKSNKDFKELTKTKPNKVRNDQTGKWKKVSFAENADVEDYLLSYADYYMQDGGTHFIINFNYKTTTVVNKMGGLIYADIHEYVKKEEHDADKIGSGMLLKSYVIYPDGDIEETE